jgi:hypothetical protein
MTILHALKVEGNRAILESAPPFVAGTADTVRLEVTFDQSWDGFLPELLAEQMGADVRWKLSLDETGGIVLPRPLTDVAIPFFLWAEGEHEGKFLRTNSVCISPEKLCTGDRDEPPTEDIIQVHEGPYRLTENGVYSTKDRYLTDDLIVDVPPVGSDTSEDTVVPEAMLAGYTAHDKEGKSIEGAIPVYLGANHLTLISPESVLLPVGNAFCPADISVTPVLQNLQVTENSKVMAEAGYAGLGEVTVDVQPRLQTKTAVKNGTVAPDEGYDGLSEVEIQVPAEGISMTACAIGSLVAYPIVAANASLPIPVMEMTSAAVGTLEQ